MSIRYLKKILLLYIENIIVKKKVSDWRVMQVARALRHLTLLSS